MAPVRAALLALAVAASGTAAADEAPRLTMIGLGAGTSCAAWTDAGRSDEGLEQWAFGFASAIAAGAQLQSGADPLGSLDADAVHAWLEQYCRRHPGDAVSVALVRLVVSGGR